MNNNNNKNIEFIINWVLMSYLFLRHVYALMNNNSII